MGTLCGYVLLGEMIGVMSGLSLCRPVVMSEESARSEENFVNGVDPVIKATSSNTRRLPIGTCLSKISIIFLLSGMF